MTEISLFNRRAFVAVSGSALLAGCQMSPDMMGAALGGAGKDADFGSLVKALHAALDKVADQTEKLFEIQASYANVFGLKKRAAALQGEAQAIRRDGRTGINFRKGEKETKGLLDDINKKLSGGANLNAQAKRTLEQGMVQHSVAIQNAWVGGVMIAKVIIDAQSAKKPSFSDIQSLKYVREILSDGPMAVKFLQTSKQTYEAYSDAFAFKAQIKVPPKPKLNSLMGGGRGRA